MVGRFIEKTLRIIRKFER